MNERQERVCWMIGCIFLSATTFVIGCALGKEDTRLGFRQEAIDAGAAHYECDPQTGETRFVWGGKANE